MAELEMWTLLAKVRYGLPAFTDPLHSVYQSGLYSTHIFMVSVYQVLSCCVCSDTVLVLSLVCEQVMQKCTLSVEDPTELGTEELILRPNRPINLKLERRA